MESRFESTWPEVFAGLDATVRQSVVATLADAALAGTEPTRQDAVDLVALACGDISEAEYRRRTAERVAGALGGDRSAEA
ncbi:hypothetical protein [Nocardia sp. alder85J]|uniref:hypothetical protein n=1 Tax=Nocardia sp. alder85J TaxID=2862949 RepID=UPI001CD6F9DD|nr:hypothetical protein [Nocardia sp. alder85J]MCX4094472.1 hypothetical protein [Nocardia sp. alder85J]